MLRKVSWGLKELIFLLGLIGSNAIATNPKDLEEIERKWKECCKSNICIGASCYTVEWRASTWSAVRQRCQGRYPDWPYAVDVFRVKNEEDIYTLWDIFSKASGYPDDMYAIPRTVWTSGTGCPKRGPEGIIVSTRWTTNQPFPKWLDDKFKGNFGIVDECKFLVIDPVPKNREIKYFFQDEYAKHAAVCEFLFPGEVPPTFLPDKTTKEPNPMTTSWTVKVASLSPATNILPTSKTMWPIDTTSLSRTTKEITSTLSLPSSTTSPRRFCKGLSAAGIKWPDTAAGSTANMSCPDGMTGYAQWKCNATTLKFTPSKPLIQECKHMWIKNLEKEIEEENDALVISLALANKTKVKKFSHGDISAFVDLSDKLFHLYIKQEGQKVPESIERKQSSFMFTQSMVDSFSNVLRVDLKGAWEILPEVHQTRAATGILKLVSTIGKRLSCFKNSEDKLQFTITAENINLQTFILDNAHENDSYFKFPKEDEGIKAKSSISFPYNFTLKNWKSPCENYNTAVGIIYNHVGDFLGDDIQEDSTTKVATKIISFSLTNTTESIVLPEGNTVSIVIEHSLIQGEAKYVLSNPQCVFWNFSKEKYGHWDTSGCILVFSNHSHTKCQCDHLTNFAVLMDVNNNIEENYVLSMMTFVCCGLSSLSLVLTIACFIFIRPLHNRRSIITANLSLCLLLTNLLIIFGLDKMQYPVLCTAIAALLHFWILSAFFWMLVEGYHLYQMVVLVFRRKSTIKIKYYYLIAYGSPAIIVGVSFGVQQEDYGGLNYCWLSNKDGLMWSFVGPACAVIVVNVIVFILTLRSASSVRIKREQSTMKKIKGWARGSMSVLCLLGLTWCTGLFYIDKNLRDFSYVFTILNGLQGVFIFLFHILLNEKVTNTIFYKCKKNRVQDTQKRFLHQLSSNQLQSKATPRTSINSLDIGHSYVSHPTPVEIPYTTTSFKTPRNITSARIGAKRGSKISLERSMEGEKTQTTSSMTGRFRGKLLLPQRLNMRSKSIPITSTKRIY